MAMAHAALAWLAGGSVALLLGVAIWTAVGRTRGSYRALDRALLAQVALTVAAALAGVASAVLTRPPAETLHLVYGGVTAVTPLVARIAVQRRDARRIGRWVAVASVVAIGAAVRSFMTGT